MKVASFMSTVHLIFSPWIVTYEYIFKALDFNKQINLIISDTAAARSLLEHNIQVSSVLINMRCSISLV